MDPIDGLDAERLSGGMHGARGSGWRRPLDLEAPPRLNAQEDVR